MNADEMSRFGMARNAAAKLERDNAPSPLGSFAREAARSVGPGLAGMATGAASGAAAGAMGLNPVTVAIGVVAGGLAGFMGARKVQDVAADAIAPNSFMGTHSAEADYGANKWSAMLGGAIGGGGAPGPLRAAGALTKMLTADGRQVLVQGLRPGADAIARQASSDIMEPLVAGGVGAGLGAVTGNGPQDVAEQAGLGLIFNRGWHPKAWVPQFGQQSSPETQHGVQGEPATGTPVEAGGVPLETNAPVVTPAVGPLKAAGATRLAGDMAAPLGIDPNTLTPSGAGATVTPNDVRRAAATLPARTLDSGGTLDVTPPRAPDPTITDLIGKDTEWQGYKGKLIDDNGRPALQLPGGEIVELPFNFHTEQSIKQLGLTPTGDHQTDRQIATRLFGDTEGEALHQVLGHIDPTSDTVLDIADLGTSMKRRKGLASIPVRDTPEFAQHARGVTDESILNAHDQITTALAAAENHPNLSDDTRTALTTKLRGDIDNLNALSSARDAWQRQRVPLPTGSPELPSQRASLAATTAADNRAAAIRELNRPSPAAIPAAIEPQPNPTQPWPNPNQASLPPRVAARAANAAEPVIPVAEVVPKPPSAPETRPVVAAAAPAAAVVTPETTAAPAVPLTPKQLSLKNGQVKQIENQIARLEASGKGTPQQLENLRNRAAAFNAQIAEAGGLKPGEAKRLAARVAEVHDSGEFELMNKIRDNGGFQPPHRGSDLIEKLVRKGAKLSEKSRAIADGFGETRDDAARVGGFGKTDGGKLADATLKSLHNPSPTALSVDKLAGALGITVKEFHAQLNEELGRVASQNGIKGDAMQPHWDRLETQHKDFTAALENPKGKGEKVAVSDLAEGDTFSMAGEKFKVTHADVVEGFDGPEGLMVVQDHDKFGTQRIDPQQEIVISNKGKGTVTDGERARAQDVLPARTDHLPADEHFSDDAYDPFAEPPAKPVIADRPPAPVDTPPAKPAAEDFALQGHATDAEIKAEADAARVKEELAKRQAAPLKGNAGDTTSDLFGPTEGETPLFNNRRDQPAPKPEPAVVVETPAAPATTNPESTTDRIKRHIRTLEYRISQRGTTDLVKKQNAARMAELRQELEQATPQNETQPTAALPPEQRSLIDGLKAHQQDVQNWIKGEKGSGRMNAMPVDILGAQAWDAALSVAIKTLEVGKSISDAVKAVIAHLRADRAAAGLPALTKAEEASIKSHIIAKSQDELRYQGERDAKFMQEMPKLAEELAAGGKTPTMQDLIDGMAKRYPDNAAYIRQNGPKIFQDMMFARDTRLTRKTESARQWGEWADKALEGASTFIDRMRRGAPLHDIKQFATVFHATYMTGIGNKMRHLAQGGLTGTESKAFGKFTEDLVGLAKGADGVHGVATDLGMNHDLKTFANRIDAIKTALAPLLNAMPRRERDAFMERIGDHICDASRDGELANQPELKKAVEAYVKIREDLLAYMKEAGVQVGDAGPRTMRRVLDRSTVLSNEKEFLAQAANAYKAKWRKEIAALNAEAATLTPLKDAKRLTAIGAEIKEISARDSADSAKKYFANIQTDEVGISSDGNDLFSSGRGNPSMLKSREFGPEADQLLGKFYLRNPDAILRTEIGDAVRAAGVARTFSGPALDAAGNPRANGEIDPMAKWKKLRSDMIAEGNESMIAPAATLMKEYFGLNGQDNPTMRKALEIAHTHAQLAFLARSAFSSLGEPFLAGIRTGKLSDVARGLVGTIKGMHRELRGMAPEESRILSNAIGASSDGFNSLLAANRFLDSYGGHGKGGELVAMFHTKTWLTALTNATHAATVDIGHSFIRTQLELRQAGGSMKTLAGKHLNEVGIGSKDIPAMLKFTEDFAKSRDKLGMLTADTPEAKMYRDALHLFKNSGGSLEVTRGVRPQHANSPAGGMFYALQSFLFAFQDQVLARQARLLRTAYRGEAVVDGVVEKMSGAERTKIVGDTLKGIATIAAAQYAIQRLREGLYSDPARTDQNKTLSPGELAQARALQMISRSSVMGGYDILFNMATGARYGQDPATRILGPSLGAASSIVGQAIGVATGNKNSPNTNTAERKLARSVWGFAAQPAMNAAASTMPGSGLVSALVQAQNHPAIREAAVRSVAGKAMIQGEKKGPMRLHVRPVP